MSLGDYPPEPLTAAEVRLLLAAAADGTVTGRRNRALIVVLWRCGLRCSEALALRPSDIDTDAGTIRVLHGKGNRARTVGADPETIAELAKWMVERGHLEVFLPNRPGIDARTSTDTAQCAMPEPLFCTVNAHPGAQLQPRYVRALMTRLGRKAGIGHRVHAHGLRHTMAVELRREGWSLSLIQRQLGHANLATTAVYLDHLYPGELVDQARRREWGI